MKSAQLASYPIIKNWKLSQIRNRARMLPLPLLFNIIQKFLPEHLGNISSFKNSYYKRIPIIRESFILKYPSPPTPTPVALFPSIEVIYQSIKHKWAWNCLDFIIVSIYSTTCILFFNFEKKFQMWFTHELLNQKMGYKSLLY